MLLLEYDIRRFAEVDLAPIPLVATLVGDPNIPQPGIRITINGNLGDSPFSRTPSLRMSSPQVFSPEGATPLSFG